MRREIPLENLEQAAELAPDDIETPKRTNNNQRPHPSNKFSLHEWIARFGPSMGWQFGEERHAKDGGRNIPFKDGCPFQPDYRNGNAAIYESATGQLGFKCFCGDHPEKSWHDLRELVEG